MRGVFSQYICVPAYALVKKPAYLSFAQGATLPVAGLTAWVSLFEEMDLQPEHKVLILGSGGVSLFALQFARLHGAQVYMTTGSQEKAHRLLKIGASGVVNYRTHPDWHLEIKELIPQGVDMVIDTAGELEKSMQVLRIGGKIKIVGFTGNAKPVFDVFAALSSQLILLASTPGSKACFKRMLAYMETKTLHPVIDRTFTISTVREAFRYLESGLHIGKVVVEL
jgi:NADPH:quinone reductase-like Zn-dependent oxidoreductase